MKFKDYSFPYYLIGVCLFSLIPAFYVWNNILYGIIELVLGALILLELYKHGIAQKNIVVTLAIAILYTIYIIRSGSNIAGAIILLLIIPLFLLRKHNIIEIYEKFTSILALLLIPSLLVYVYLIFLEGDLPREIIDAKNYEKTNTYYLYPFLVVSTSYEGLITRFMGYFDEPGVVGTISSIILIAEKYNLRRPKNIIFLISGIASMSLFFFLMSFCYMLFFVKVKYKVIIGLITLAIAYSLKDNEIFNNRILSRFVVEEGIVHDNRTDSSFDRYYKNFQNSSDYIWGLGRGVGYAHDNHGGSSYKFLIVDYGIVFFILYLLCFFAYVIRISHSLKFLLAFSIIFLGTIYQRPYIENKAMLFLLLSTAYIFNKKEENETNL